MTNLMIVESLKKSKTIQSYLGAGWIVEPCFGHIRDLPAKSLGVDLISFDCNYEILSQSKKQVSKLKALAKSADSVYLSTDCDREGEAIAWHLTVALNLKSFQRAAFNEITKKAITKAVAEAGPINQNRVYAQTCRRVADRLVGYLVSPAVSKSANGERYSAGRVQSPALRLVVERERAISAFIPTPYLDVYLNFNTNGIRWKAKWDTAPYLEHQDSYFNDKTIANKIATVHQVTVDKLTGGKEQRHAPPPFITSTLQQAASVMLKIRPKICMQLAQSLFDTGYITYHRTDNPNLSDEGATSILNWLATSLYKNHAALTQNKWKASADAQEAHEAIRPTDVCKTPDLLKNVLDSQEWSLYKLIWMRAVASQMKAAQFEKTNAILLSQEKVQDKHPKFIAEGRVLLYAGWLSLTQGDDTDESQKNADQLLPPLAVHKVLIVEKGEVLEKKTKAPSRYTEASLIKALEKLGIGRPATYASIMENIINRNYVLVTKRQLSATSSGDRLISMLEGQFSFVNYDYTREMETQLDKIALGQKSYLDVITSIHQQLTTELPALDTVSNSQSVDSISQHSCPECGSALRLVNNSFWGCQAYPSCRYTAPNENGELGQRVKKEKVFDSTYPCACGSGYLQRRPYKNTWFWGCSNYPECKNTKSDSKGVPVDKIDNNKKSAAPKMGKAGMKCPDCKKGLLVKRIIKTGSNQGKSFLGCNSYPKCNHFNWANQS